MTWDFSVIARSTNHPHKVLERILNTSEPPITFTEKGKDDKIVEKASVSGLLYHIRKEFDPIYFGKRLYIHDPELHYYRLDTGDIEKNMGVCLQLKGVTDTKPIVDAMKNLVHHSGSYPFVEGRGTINLINGVYDVKTGKLLPSNNTMYDYVVRTQYIPQPTTELDALLEVYGTDEPVYVLAKCLWQKCWLETLKEITVFYGEIDTAKTTMGVELVQAVLDGNSNRGYNTASVPLGALLADFGIAPLEGKLFNLGDDLPDRLIKNASGICEFVGRVSHSIEHKGVTRYDGVITAYCMFTCNNLPPLDDDDLAIWSKIRLHECTRVFKRGEIHDDIFTDKLRQQMLVKALELVRKWLTRPYYNDQTKEEVRRIWRSASEDAQEFFAEILIPDDCAKTKGLDIRKAYEKWCKRMVPPKTLHFKNLNNIIKLYYRVRNSERFYTLVLKDEPPMVNKTVSKFTHSVSHHIKFKIKDARCNIRGCTNAGEWHDKSVPSLPHSLCDKHYQELKNG